MAALKIAYPPDGAKIDLGIAEGSVAPRLALKALGGVPPFGWFVGPGQLCIGGRKRGPAHDSQSAALLSQSPTPFCNGP